MKIVIGLGNPGPEYDRTRHNMGFKVIDDIADFYHIELNHSKFKGKYGTGSVNGEKVILFKPYTYMNLSGEAVLEIVSFFKVEPKDIIVIYDDIDVEPGQVRIRKSGSPGSHNGMRSVTEKLGSQDFPRVRVGTGKPEGREELIEYVIGAIDDKDKPLLLDGIERAAEAVRMILTDGMDVAMNKFNVRHVNNKNQEEVE